MLSKGEFWRTDRTRAWQPGEILLNKEEKDYMVGRYKYSDLLDNIWLVEVQFKIIMESRINFDNANKQFKDE
jgi:hypothetical protein